MVMVPLVMETVSEEPGRPLVPVQLTHVEAENHEPPPFTLEHALLGVAVIIIAIIVSIVMEQHRPGKTVAVFVAKPCRLDIVVWGGQV